MLKNHALRYEEKNGKKYVWDELRKKFVTATPEENVRQQLIHHLVYDKKISPSLIAIERAIPYGKLTKRFDLLIFTREAKPWLIAECKAPGEKLSEKTLQQLAVYNTQFQAKILLVTNGRELTCFVGQENGSYLLQHEVPEMKG